MIKKTLLMLGLAISSSWLLTANAQADGENIFLKNADKCLEIMEQAAQQMKVKGAAVMAFFPDEAAQTWVSKMRTAGALRNESANYLAVAYTKLAEMADTHKNSGSGEREPLLGEFGWQGGIIKKVNSGYILAAFSGATGEQDAEIAQQGLDELSGFYE